MDEKESKGLDFGLLWVSTRAFRPPHQCKSGAENATKIASQTGTFALGEVKYIGSKNDWPAIKRLRCFSLKQNSHTIKNKLFSIEN